MKNIIAFSSTHGTGKTSLAYSLASKMKLAGHNVIVLDELARKCPFPINKDGDTRTQTWIICKQITEELELMEKVDYLIVDRGVMDGLFYDFVVNKGDNTCNEFFFYLKKHISNYYHKIYVPDKDSFNFQFDDGVRDLEQKFRDDVYNKVIEIYRHSELPHKIIHKPEEVYADLGV